MGLPHEMVVVVDPERFEAPSELQEEEMAVIREHIEETPSKIYGNSHDKNTILTRKFTSNTLNLSIIPRN